MVRLERFLPVIFSACVVAPPAGAPTAAPESGEAAPVQVLRAATSVGDLYKPGEVRAFEIRQAGQVIGRSWGRYAGQVGSGRHRFETRVELQVPGRTALRSAGEIVLDEHGYLVEGFERSDAAELRFARDGNVLRFSDGQRDDEFTYDPEVRDTAFMAHSEILHAEIMFGLRELSAGTAAWRVIALSGGPPVEWTGEVSPGPGEGEIRVATNLGEVIALHEGRVEAIKVEDSQLAISALEQPEWPEFTVTGPRQLQYVAPEGLRIESLEIPAGEHGPVLAGELVTPQQGTGPLPGVLFVSGTGQEDRYGFAGPPPVDLGGHEITDALAQAGFAVLRFDERGRGASGPGPLSFFGQVDDARRALATLLVQDRVDPDRIIVVAHGEGGLRALALVQQRPRDVHALALLASPGRGYAEILRAQGQAQLSQLPPELRDEAAAEHKQMVAELTAGRVPPELAGQAQWLREVFEIVPERLVASLKIPLWIAQGDKDFEVDPVADSTALLRAAKSAKLRVQLQRFADLDHLFKPELGVSRPDRYLEDRRVAPGFLAALVTWAKQALATTQPANAKRPASRAS